MPKSLANSIAAIRPLSGTGTITSMFESGNSFGILDASLRPIFNLARCTLIPSIIESGRAK